MASTAILMKSGMKYAYLAAFFALLSGFFHPIITETSFGVVLVGTLVLFTGLLGGILLYKAVMMQDEEAKPSKKGRSSGRKRYSGRKQAALLAAGFVLIIISLASIYHLTDRV